MHFSLIYNMLYSNLFPQPVFFDSSDPICTHNFDEVLSDDSAALSWLRDLAR